MGKKYDQIGRFIYYEKHEIHEKNELYEVKKNE
jgi:hypothetical protein